MFQKYCIKNITLHELKVPAEYTPCFYLVNPRKYKYILINKNTKPV